MSDDALATLLPRVAAALPRLRLGEWPTPVEALPINGADLYVKREDLSSPIYGGNKVRCLEPVLAAARARGAKRAVATGAWGSNQALALAVHAARQGFETAAVLFPQPAGQAAADNLRALLGTDCDVQLLPSIVTFPWAAWRARRRGTVVVPPGAAVPRGALGHLAAACEVALSVDAGDVPAPAHVALAVGSTCTTAGLLVGFCAAAQLGIGLRRPPIVHAVRVTPWPVTARFRILGLAMRTAALLARLGGPTIEPAMLRAHLRVSGAYLGRGYGHATTAGKAAIACFDAAHGPHLDTTYSGKAGAWLIDHLPQLEGPVLFWATKSRALPPAVTPERLATFAPSVRRWLDPR